MANPIIKIKRGATAPVATLSAGEFAIDQVAKNLYLGVEVGGNVTNEIVGGNGTFATHTDVATAVSAGTGSLGTMSTQNANSVAITGGTIDDTAIGATTPANGKFTQISVTNGDILMSGGGNIDMNFAKVVNLAAPVSANDAVRKTDLDSAISALGSVFHYVGDVSAYTNASNPFELANIVDQSTGAYYRVDVAGTYTAGVGPSMEAKVGDAFVKTSTGWQKLDNVDAVVGGTLNEIAVTGDENTGYTVSIDPVFSGRVTTAETDITDLEGKTQNIDLTDTTAGTTRISGDVVFGTGINAHNFKVSSMGVVSINSMTNSATVDTYGTLNINAGGGLGGVGAWIGLQSSGHLVANGAGLEIQGFVIDGGSY